MGEVEGGVGRCLGADTTKEAPQRLGGLQVLPLLLKDGDTHSAHGTYTHPARNRARGGGPVWGSTSGQQDASGGNEAGDEGAQGGGKGRHGAVLGPRGMRRTSRLQGSPGSDLWSPAARASQAGSNAFCALSASSPCVERVATGLSGAKKLGGRRWRMPSTL